jgi:mannonate dehydratase
MMEIAEYLPTTPSPLWKLARQAGVDYAVGGLPFDDPFNGTDAPWDYLPLLRTKQAYEHAGFALAVVEARPPLNAAKRGLPGRDAEIATVCTLLENMGRLRIPVWCWYAAS